MRRDFVYWALALATGLVLWVGMVWAFTPEELMGERQIKPPVCKEGKCTMDQADLEFIFQRGRLMEGIANGLHERLKSCNGGRSV